MLAYTVSLLEIDSFKGRQQQEAAASILHRWISAVTPPSPLISYFMLQLDIWPLTVHSALIYRLVCSSTEVDVPFRGGGGRGGALLWELDGSWLRNQFDWTALQIA